MNTLDITKLNASQKRVLAYYAYLGDYSYLLNDSYTDIFRAINVKRESYISISGRLYDEGWITKPTAFRPGMIKGCRRFEVLAYMIEHASEVVERINGTFRCYSFPSEFYKLVKYIVTGDQRPREFRLDFITNLYFIRKEEWLRRLYGIMEKNVHENYVITELETRIACGIPASDAELDMLCMDTKKDPILSMNLEDLKALFKYCRDGQFEAGSMPSPARPYQLMLHAIRQCQLGNYPEAKGLFSAALKVYNRTAYIKNVPTLVFPAYYMVMTYAHLPNGEGLELLRKFLKKREVESTPWTYPAYVLAYAFASDNRMPELAMLERLASYAFMGISAVSYGHLAWVFSRYFGLNSPKVSYNTAAPAYDIVAFEGMKYLHLPKEKEQELKEKYGPYPALTSIKKLEEWELAIEDLLRVVDKESTAAKGAEKRERIVYVVSNRDDTVAPMLQTLLKSGEWGRPKPAPKKKFVEGDIPCMNDTDREVGQMAVKLDPYSLFPQYPTMQAVGHLLVGSGRVYMQQSDGSLGNPVSIDAEDPYVRLKRKAGVITIDSNVDPSKLDYDFDGGQITIRKGKGEYTSIDISPAKYSIIKRLLRLKEFPLEAEEQVRTFLTKLESVIEVRSPLIDSNAIPTVEGVPALVVKAMPAQGMSYSLLVQAKPEPNGDTYCVPGAGRGVVYSVVDGKNVRVKRDIDGELKRYADLVDFFEGAGLELGDDNTCVADIDAMLSVIDYARSSNGELSIEWPEGKKLSLKKAAAGSSWSIGLKSDNGWFDIEGDVRIDDDTVLDVARLMELMGESKGRFIKLNDQDYIEIDKKLRRQLERLEGLAVKNRNKMQISQINAAMLDDSALDGEIKVGFDKKLADLRKRVRESMAQAPVTPAALQARLRPYQEEGFQWMARLAGWGAGACLADDMGLGKTVQTIAFLLMKAGEGPALVVAPASVVPNWAAELARFAPSLRPIVLNKADNRSTALRKAGPYDVVITTYGLLNTEVEELSQTKFATVCLDEAHTIKNRETKMSQAAMKLQADYRIILTGTPIQNHLGELWNLFRFINPGLLGSFESFKRKFVVPITQDGDKARRKALQAIIKPFMLRRTKNEVIDDLPDKTEIVYPVELSDEEMAVYETMRIKAVEAIEEAKDVDINTLAEITRLRRAACSLQLVNDKWPSAGSKTQAFIDLVRDFKGDGNRMLVFSQFTSYLEIVRRALDQAGEKYLYLDGSTTMKQREKIVEEFRSGSCPLFLISLKAGGLGLNLPEANYVVHLDPWWNPAIEQQATDRAYRIGQQRAVTVYHLVAQHTIEEKIRRLHRTKRDLADSLLEGSGQAGKLTIDDILELLSQR